MIITILVLIFVRIDIKTNTTINDEKWPQARP